MIALQISRQTSRCVAFIQLANDCVAGLIETGQLVHMCTHMFDNDIDFQTQANLIAQLIDDMRAYTDTVERTYAQMIVGPQMAMMLNDQRLATLTDMANAVFAVNSDGEGTSPREVALVDETGEVVTHIPVFVYGNIHLWTIPVDTYTPEESTVIIDDVVAAYDEAKIKVQHMREGEDY